MTDYLTIRKSIRRPSGWAKPTPESVAEAIAHFESLPKEQIIFTLEEFKEKFPLWKEMITECEKKEIEKVELIHRDGNVVKVYYKNGLAGPTKLLCNLPQHHYRVDVPMKCRNIIAYDARPMDERLCNSVELRDQIWVPGFPNLVTLCRQCGHIAIDGYSSKYPLPHSSDPNHEVPEIFP